MCGEEWCLRSDVNSLCVGVGEREGVGVGLCVGVRGGVGVGLSIILFWCLPSHPHRPRPRSAHAIYLRPLANSASGIPGVIACEHSQSEHLQKLPVTRRAASNAPPTPTAATPGVAGRASASIAAAW